MMTLEAQERKESKVDESSTLSPVKTTVLIALIVAIFSVVWWVVSATADEPDIIAPTDSGGYVSEDSGSSSL